MSLANDLRDRSLRLKLGLARWEQGLVRDVISLLNEGDGDLERRIGLAVERSASEDAIRRLRRIREELRTVNAEAYQAVGKRLTSELQEASVRTAGRYAEVLEAGIPLDFSFTRPSAPLLRAIVTSQPLQGALLKDHVTKLAGNRLDALTRQLELGLLQGESLSQLLQRVRGTRRGGFRDGVLERVGRHQAATLTRTAAMHVTETAREQLFQENADIVVGTMWIATLDHRTCRICQPRDGLVWLYDPESGTYVPDGHSLAWLGGPGRAHFRDRCTGIPVLNDLSELEAAGIDTSKLTSGERAAWENPVPVTTDYGEWIRDQPYEIQLAALGAKGRVELIRKGVQLEEAWAKRFAVTLTDTAPLDDVLPPGPPDGPTLRAELEQPLDELTQKLDALAAERIKASDALRDALLRGHRDAFSAAEKEVKRIEKEFQATERLRTEAVVAALSRGKTPQAFEAEYSARASFRKPLEEATEILGQIWGRPLPKVKPKVVTTQRFTSFFSSEDLQVHLRRDAPTSIALHELGHWIEWFDPKLHERIIDLYTKRTAGDALHAYNYVKIKPGKWVHPYMGAWYINTSGRQWASEVLSVSLQMLVEDPLKLMRGDPELFDLLVDWMRGQ